MPRPPELLRLVLDTALRVERDNRVVGAGNLRFADLFTELRAPAREVEFQRTASSCVTGRVTPRARRPPCGVVDEARLGGDGIDSFSPYLWLGQFIHAGYNASMGLGRYRVEAASLRGDPLSPFVGDTSRS